MKNLIIGLGNTGVQIIKAIMKSSMLDDIKLYAIDSVTTSVDAAFVDRVTVIPIQSDEKQGSGRNRESRHLLVVLDLVLQHLCVRHSFQEVFR